MTAEQLDLFADLEQAPAVNGREEWAARFERALWVAPYDCSGGLRKGESVSGWVCPACGRVEINEFLLNLNHGYDPSIPGRMAGAVERFGQTCSRLMLLASQRRSAEASYDRHRAAARAAARAGDQAAASRHDRAADEAGERLSRLEAAS